jgi:hypothetical protein
MFATAAAYFVDTRARRTTELGMSGCLRHFAKHANEIGDVRMPPSVAQSDGVPANEGVIPFDMALAIFINSAERTARDLWTHGQPLPCVDPRHSYDQTW